MTDISKTEFHVVACPDRNPQVQVFRGNRRWIAIHIKDFGEAIMLAHVIVQAAPQLLEAMAAFPSSRKRMERCPCGVHPDNHCNKCD